jgi:hypothetical protein
LLFTSAVEGFDLWVSGTVLHFWPEGGQPPSQRLRLQDVTSMQSERTLTLAGDTCVTVKSWNSRQQDAFSQTARRQGLLGNG